MGKKLAELRKNKTIIKFFIPILFFPFFCRVEILESQLSAYSKSMTEDKLRDEAQRLMEEKEEYQEIAKVTLKKIMDEKLEAVKKLKETEKQLSTTEDEYAVLKELYDRDLDENKKLAEQVRGRTIII